MHSLHTAIDLGLYCPYWRSGKTSLIDVFMDHGDGPKDTDAFIYSDSLFGSV